MNLKKFVALTSVAIFFGAIAYASKINRLELSQLPERTEATVLANVVQVNQKENLDEVTIKVVSVVKGEVEEKQLHLVLSPRGVKDFDPALKVGDNGVFFLKEIKGSDAKLAYWGSVAIFPKNHFSVAENQKPE